MARQVLPIIGAVVGGMVGGPTGAQIGFALGSIVGNAVDPQIIKGPRIGDAGIQTSAEGVPRPVVFGTAPIMGNVIARGNRKIKKHREGGKGGPVTETERVYWTFAIRLGEPIASITRIWEDEKLVYDVTPDSTIKSESADYENKFTFYDGSETQLPDPDLEAFLGAGNSPSYRGTSYVVFPNYDLTDRRESIPNYRFECASNVDIDQVTNVMALGDVAVASSRVGFSETGQSWGATQTPPFGIVYLQATGSRFVSWSGTTAYYSDDRGASWVTATGSLGGSGGSRFGSTNGNVVLIAGGSNGVYRSADSGESYNQVTGVPHTVNAVCCNGSYSIGVQDTINAPVVYSADNGLTYSAGGTLSGSEIPADGPKIATDGIGFLIIGKKLGAPHAWSTNDGNTIFDVSLPSASATSATCVTFGNNTWVVGADNGEIYRKVGTDPWELASDSLGTFAQDVVFNGTYFVMGGGNTGGSGVIKTSTDGNTWTTATQSDPMAYGVYALAALPPIAASQVGQPVSLAAIVSAVHGRTLQPPSKYDVTALTDMVDGIVFAGDYTCADGIRTAIQPYFADASEWGDKIRYIKRGAAVVKTLSEADLVDEPEESTRESAIEYPKTLDFFYQSPAVGYAPTKASVIRSSPEVKVVGSVSIQSPVVFSDQDEAKQIADKMMKVAYAEAAGETTFTVTDEHLDLVPSDNIGLSLRGSVRRLRITKIEDDPGARKLTCRGDRQSAYTSQLTGIPLPPPTPPPPSIVGASLFVFGDWPALRDDDDALGYYIGAGGLTAAWHGATVQRKLPNATDFSSLQSFSSGTIIGTLLAGVADASEHYTDTTNTLEIQLNLDEEIDSLTDAQFLSEGGGLAVENDDGSWELMQYRDAVQHTDGTYTLSHLLRGRLNSGTQAKTVGKRVVLLNSVAYVSAQVSYIGNDLTHRAVSDGRSPETATQYTDTYQGASQTEWPCASLTAVHNGDSVDCSVVPRHRFGTEDNPIRSVNWTGYFWTATDGTNSATVEGTPATASFNVTGWSSPITVTVAQLNRYTGAGPAITEVIA